MWHPLPASHARRAHPKPQGETHEQALFPEASYRPGQISAWDEADFVRAVKATGKKQPIIAGVVTAVCVAFPTLSAQEEGYEVFVVTDASGTFNELTRDSAWDRMSAAGAQLISWFAVACELHRDWRNNVEGLGALCANHIPDYKNLMTSYSNSGPRLKIGFARSPDHGSRLHPGLS